MAYVDGEAIIPGKPSDPRLRHLIFSGIEIPEQFLRRFDE